MIKKGLEIIAWLTAILLFVYASHAVVAAAPTGDVGVQSTTDSRSDVPAFLRGIKK